MWRLSHFVLCPFSRKVRLVLAEKQICFDLYEVAPRRRPAIFQAGHTGTTPAMFETETGVMLEDSNAICEYLEEIVPQPSVLPANALGRAEVRRLVAWWDDHFYAEVTWPLLRSRLIKIERTTHNDQLRTDAYLAAIDGHLADHAWLAGPALSLADFAAAAQLSVVDYLGGIDWSGHVRLKAWYAALKARPSFQPLLSDREEGVEPSRSYQEHTF